MKSPIADIKENLIRQEILAELKEELSRGLDKTISARTNPIRWLILHYFIGLNVMVFFCFVWEMVLTAWDKTFSILIPLHLPTAVFKYVVFSLPAVFSFLHFSHSWRRGGFIIRSKPAAEESKPGIRRFFKSYWQEILTVLMFVVWAGTYFLIASHIDMAKTEHIGVKVDKEIPFVPQFIFIYIGLYTMYVYPYLLVKDKDFFKVFTGAYITLMVIIYSIFLLFPVSIDRPPIEVVDFTSWTLNIVYSLDKPVNCFPSSHVAMTLMSALTIWEINRIWGLFAILYALSIAISTLFLKQHYALDVVVAIFITSIVYYAYFKQKITTVLGRNLRTWEQEIGSNFTLWLETRLDPILDKAINKRVEEAVHKALAEMREKQDAGNGKP